MGDRTGSSSTVLRDLCRWEEAGGGWRVVSLTADTAEISLLTCSRGEEMHRLRGPSSPELLRHLRNRSRDDE